VAAILSLYGAKNNPKIVTKITAVRPKGALAQAPPPKYATGWGTEAPSVVQGQSPGGGLEAKPPEAYTECIIINGLLTEKRSKNIQHKEN